MSFSIAVVCEARADMQTGCDLADRVIGERADWITPEVIDSYRRYRGFEENDSFLRWTEVKNHAGELGRGAHGKFDGSPGAPDALATRRALLLLIRSKRSPDAVILLRDSDREREHGMYQARTEFNHASDLPIVIGLARINRECWVLAGFVPDDDSEQRTLGGLRDGQELGFDPTAQPERMTARTKTAKKNPKRVLAILSGGDPERERRCWMETPLETLRLRGAGVGLSAYLEEVDERLVPLFA